METFDGTYLKRYYCFAYILSAACVICMTLLGIFAFTKDTWSYGIIVLLALSLVLAVLAIISWVALYREEGRHRERWFPKEFPKEMLTELKNDLIDLKEQKKGLEDVISKLAAEREAFEKAKEEFEKGEMKLAAEREAFEKAKKELGSVNEAGVKGKSRKRKN